MGFKGTSTGRGEVCWRVDPKLAFVVLFQGMGNLRKETCLNTVTLEVGRDRPDFRSL